MTVLKAISAFVVVAALASVAVANPVAFSMNDASYYTIQYFDENEQVTAVELFVENDSLFGSTMTLVNEDGGAYPSVDMFMAGFQMLAVQITLTRQDENQWSGQGSITFLDIEGTAKFAALYSPYTVSYHDGELTLLGNLSAPVGADSILLGEGDDWVYQVDEETQFVVPGRILPIGGMVLVCNVGEVSDLDALLLDSSSTGMATITGNASVMPEPATLAMLALGTLLLMRRRRRAFA